MKKGVFYSLAIAGTMVFASCGGNEEVVEETPLEICFYTYDSSATEFTWTAYKTNDKKPVPGTFNVIDITSDGSSDNPMALIKSMKFSMKTASVNTENEERDGKIAQFFFGTIKTSSIDGRVKELKDNGKAVIEISMNGVKADVEGDYTFEGGKFTFDTSVDVGKWNALSGIQALNTICKELHTGDDGVSKLWSEVALSFSTQFISDCK
jgi:hypothetical protein